MLPQAPIIKPVSRKTQRPVRTILWAGFVAGSLDALAAVLQYVVQTGKNPVRIFQYIASGIFGKDAFVGGLSMAFRGLFFHYFIAYSFVGFFFLIYPRLGWLTRHKVLGGLIYGLFVWLVMNEIVLPLSNVPSLPFSLPQALKGSLILMVAVGLPTSFIVATYYRKRGRPA